MDDELLPGAFSTVTRLSAKALRLYADQGLLAPARVDAVTGYRRYRRDQIPRARTIAELRSLGLPLARVAELVDLSAQERTTRLHEWLDAAEGTLRRRRSAVDAMGRRGAAPEIPVRVVDVPAVPVMYRQGNVHIDRLDAFIAECLDRLRPHAPPRPGVEPRHRVFFHGMVTADGDGPIEVAVDVPPGTGPVDDLRCRIVPAHRAATVEVDAAHADHPAVLSRYDALDAWLEARPEERLIDAPYETHPGRTGPFDISHPLAP